MSTPRSTVGYRVKITGSRDPFKWEVERSINGGIWTRPSKDCIGEAPTREAAIAWAREAAHDAEDARMQTTTVEVLDLFEVNPNATPLEDVEIPDTLPAWMSLGTEPDPDVELGSN